jgi:thiamine-phosphate pyrophosphorylase
VSAEAGPRLPPRLVALTPGTLAEPEFAAFLAQARRAVGAGLPGILLREPGVCDRALLELALELRSLVDARGPGAPWLGVHDRVHVALAVRADGVHLGFRSLRPAAARRAARAMGGLAAPLAIGLSTHAGDRPESWREADYRFLGPVFPTPSKHGLLEPIGLDGIADACAVADASAVPVWAIGGVQPENARAVVRAGARGVAVQAAVFGHADAARSVRALLAALD